MRQPEPVSPGTITSETITLEPGQTDAADQGFQHVSVLPQATIAGLNLQPQGDYLDATVGGGGHSRLMLMTAPTIQITALDQDVLALAAARQALVAWGDRVTFEHTNFAHFQAGERRFDGILADLGVSSAQLDIADRGFSFRHAAPLDMRMDQRQTLTAAEIVNTWDEKALADAFYTYGEERLSRRIAHQIVESRPFQTTTDLANAIWQCVPKAYRHGRIHPATRTFQALRICVNQELAVLEQFIEQAPHWLKPGGRLVIISFHSLEDRIVKHRLRAHPLLKVITKKPITPQVEEVQKNPRARSAKLRIAECLVPET
jgi:16S rRNA (cytosine1402-N4)-methyltransferase